MANLLCRLEGTWQEIAERIPDFDTRKLEVIIYDAEDEPQDAPAAAISQVGQSIRPTLTEILREIEHRSHSMNPKPSATDWLREGRDGGMFGYEPAE